MPRGPPINQTWIWEKATTMPRRSARCFLLSVATGHRPAGAADLSIDAGAAVWQRANYSAFQSAVQRQI